jgi:hypothetical protein
MEVKEKIRCKPGRVAVGPETQSYGLLLETETAEWGKRRPEGLSSLVRRLLRKEFEDSGDKPG